MFTFFQQTFVRVALSVKRLLSPSFQPKSQQEGHQEEELVLRDDNNRYHLLLMVEEDPFLQFFSLRLLRRKNNHLIRHQLMFQEQYLHLHIKLSLKRFDS